MFDATTYTQRRRALSQEVEQGLILLVGNEQSSMNFADNWYPFRQDSSFLYYCGLDKPHLALVIDLDNGREILFGDDSSIDDIIWTGPVPSLDELAERAGIAKARPYDEISPFLQNSSDRPIHFLPPYRPEHKLKLGRWLDMESEQTSRKISTQLIRAIVKQRNTKTEAELAQIEEAVNISAAMHRNAMESARIGMKEYEVMSRVYQTALENDGQPAFPIILTTKGHILHNHEYHHPIEKGDMILCDAGAENRMHYAGDLTRTFPAGKQFTSRQRELYQIVLAAQQAAVEAMAPGVLFKDVHLTACRKLVEGLQSVGLMKGDPDDAVAAGAHTLFFQCGLGHMLGLDVHDMENLGEEFVGYGPDRSQSTKFGLKSLRLGRALEAGFVVTVEPGVYIIPELIDLRRSQSKYTDFVRYDNLEDFREFSGIRIEDDYVITEQGSRLLGDPLPKKLEAIETLREKALG